MKQSVRLFHYTALAEGWSSILLILIAWPIKAFTGWEYGVKALGMPHGILFILFNLFVAWFFFREKLNFKQSAFGVIASFLPGGTFLFDRTIKKLDESTSNTNEEK